MADWWRNVTDALGFTKKKLPVDATPQLDQRKVSAGNLFGDYTTKLFKDMYETPSGFGDRSKAQEAIYNYLQPPQLYQPKPYDFGAPMPTQTVKEGALQMPTRFGQAFYQGNIPQSDQTKMLTGMMPKTPTAPVNAGDLSKYGGMYDQLISDVRSQNVAPTTGFDPEQTRLMYELATQGMDKSQADASKILREQFGRSGVLQSTPGMRAQGDLALEFGKARNAALMQGQLAALQAEREDKRANAMLRSNMLNQLGGAIGMGQGSAIQQYGLNQQGRAEDASNRQEQRTNIELLSSLGQLDRANMESDFNNFLKSQQFGREGRAIDMGEAWRQYLMSQQNMMTGTDQGNEALLKNLGLTEAGKQKNMEYIMRLLSGLGNYASGDPYTPDSVLNAQRYQMSQQDQAGRLGNTMELFSNLFSFGGGGGKKKKGGG